MSATQEAEAVQPMRPVQPRPVTPVGILAAQLEELTRQLDAVDSIEPATKALLRSSSRLAGGLERYVEESTSPQSPALEQLARRTHEHDWSRKKGVVPLEQEMLSGHVEGQFLKFLVRATRATHILEIGMFTGYSALAMAEGLPEHGALVACEIDAFAAQFAQECFALSPAGDKIAVEVGPAKRTLDALAAANESFDLVFIDADKAGYVEYLDVVLSSGLLAPHGIVCVDNTLMQGQPYAAEQRTDNGAAIAAFNRVVADDPRVEQVLLPLRDGLTLIRRADSP